jgi:sucrose phosphorylase
VDLNYGSPAVLVEIIHTLLFYVKQGAEIIRLDAVAYLWKQLGTPCIHLPETHRIIQLLRAVLDRVAPHVFLITETNVPHRENITYFGNGENEAQLVYNFTLPPLVLHTFLTGDAGPLSRWAATLDTPSDRTTYFNFLASHDGIGVNPVRDILPAQEIERLVDAVLAHGGRISYKDNPDGTQSPYELNIGYFDALSDPASHEPLDRQVERFLAAHAILCALKGVPGIYFHSLFGSRSWPEGAEQTGHNRTINRQKFNRSDLEGELALPQGIRPKVFHGLRHLLRVRMSHPAFHPHGSQVILDPQPGIFICWRVSPDRTDRVLCVQNVRDRKQVFHLPDILLTPLDLLCQTEVNPGPTRVIDLEPYQSIWLASG